jgi:recombination protein RecR
MFSPLIEQLINALRCLPGVGPKTAQRMAIMLLQHNRENGLKLADLLHQALTKIGHCQHCHILCETTSCKLCDDPTRDNSLLCVVGTPADVIAFEQTGNFRGQYFVLTGQLSPLDGIGPNEAGINRLLQRIQQGPPLNEIILATNTTVEGEATAHYIANLVKDMKIKCTRIAYGVPIGGELEYLDINTLARSFSARTTLTFE